MPPAPMLRATLVLLTFALLCLGAGAALSACGSSDSGDDAGGGDGAIGHDGGDAGERPTAIPELDPPPTEASDVVLDEAIGIQRSRTRLLVMLRETADASQVVPAVLDACPAGTTLIGGAPELALMVIRIPVGSPDGALAAARVAVAAVDGVEVATEDWTLAPESLVPAPPDSEAMLLGWTWETPPSGNNWWLEMIRMPAAWNWNDAIERSHGSTRIGLLEANIANHEELGGLFTNLDPDEDVSMHATRVASVMVARADDRLGMNGVTQYGRVTASAEHGREVDFDLWGDVVVSDFRQLVRNADVRVVNISLGYNWFAQQRDEHDAASYPAPPDDRPDQRRLVAEAGVIALRQARFLSRLPRPVFIVAAAGNDGVDPASLPMVLSPETLARAARWEQPDARWNSPYCHAAIVGEADNVFCVEGLAKTSGEIRRWPGSDVGGTIAAPAEQILTAGGDTADVDYHVGSGTSFAAPIVTGVIAHMLAFHPDLDVQTVQSALLDTARPSSGGADALDAFAAMMALPTVTANPQRDSRLALYDVDDGTADGDDFTTDVDMPGDGQLDASDFRRVRDGALWNMRIRSGFEEHAPGHMKLDHNRDGRLDDMHPEIWSRLDFDGDAEVTEADVAAVCDSPLWSDRIPGATLRDLVFSGDITIDAAPLWAAGVRAISAQATETPYPFPVAQTDTDDAVYTVVAGPRTTLTTTITDGDAGVDVEPIVIDILPGQDIRLTLVPHVLCMGTPMCPAGAGTTLTGSITMDDGADPMAPVVGASLYLSNGSCGPADTETPGGSTDADGHFLIPSIPGNCDLWLQIIAGGRHTETPVFPRSCLDTVAIVRLEDTTPCL